MTNNDATNYAIIALLNLQKTKSKITPDNLLYEMCSLFDLYSEESIAKEILFRF